jgi:hypothetical protein
MFGRQGAWSAKKAAPFAGERGSTELSPDSASRDLTCAHQRRGLRIGVRHDVKAIPHSRPRGAPGGW